MTDEKAINIARDFNKWRRGAEIIPPTPKDIGLAIDYMIKALERVGTKKKDKETRNKQRK